MMRTKLCYKEFTSRSGFDELVEEINKEIPDASLIISIKSEEKLIEHVDGYLDSYDDWIKEYKIKVFYKEKVEIGPLFPG